MALLFLVLGAVGLLLSAVGQAGGSPGSAYAPEPGGRSFTVMTFNLHHGIDGRSQYNLRRAVDVIARIQPALVGLQEVTRNHSSYQCDDQPALLAAGLHRATGRPWYQVYVKEWTVHWDRACLEQGKGDGPNTEGLAFLAPEPIQITGVRKLPAGRLALAVRVPSTRGVPIIVTHLTSGANGVTDRAAQIDRILPWAEAQGRPHVLVGDINTDAGAPELGALMASYRDAWTAGAAAGTSRGVPDGATLVRGRRRVDYIFFTPGTGLSLDWVETVDTSALLAVHASDHHPVIASFRLP